MKKCGNCGRESMDNAKFCQFCGAEYEQDTAPQGVENPSPQGSENIAPPLPEVYAAPQTPPQQVQSGPAPTNKGLVWLIVSSILTFFGCCCIPGCFLQIGTIVTSAISVSKHKKGDYEGSAQMAKVSMIIFFSVLALSLILLVVFIATGYYADIFDTYSEFYSEFY